MKKILINLLLVLIAKLLILVCGSIALVYFHIKMLIWLFRFGWSKTRDYMVEYYWLMALSIDQTGGVICKDWFNDWMLKDSKVYKYGHPDQTVSHVTGVNNKKNNLRLIGRVLAKILNFIDKNHVEKAAVNEQYTNKYN